MDDTGSDDAELGMVAPPIIKSPPLELSFEELRFEVKGPKGTRLEILKGISGKCRPGRVLAIM